MLEKPRRLFVFCIEEWGDCFSPRLQEWRASGRVHLCCPRNAAPVRLPKVHANGADTEGVEELKEDLAMCVARLETGHYTQLVLSRELQALCDMPAYRRCLAEPLLALQSYRSGRGQELPAFMGENTVPALLKAHHLRLRITRN